jgi:ABC-type dipeptide/oligopeptide/nickel transport system ATPase subunit
MAPDTLLTVNSVSKVYGSVRALDNVSLTLATRSTIALVGASGSGKSTLARCIAGLESPDSGEIVVAGRPPHPPTVQLLFQDPAMSFNPRFTVAEIIAEPLRIMNLGTDRDRGEAAVELLRAVGLPPECASRGPRQLSGGEKARLALARALAAAPRIVILDETLSPLDEFTRKRILALLSQLQAERSLSYIIVTHDLDLAASAASEIFVLGGQQ